MSLFGDVENTCATSFFVALAEEDEAADVEVVEVSTINVEVAVVLVVKDSGNAASINSAYSAFIVDDGSVWFESVFACSDNASRSSTSFD